MSDASEQTDVRKYLSSIDETIRKSQELINLSKQKIEETNRKCAELGITPEQLRNFDFHNLNLPEDVMRDLEEDQQKWDAEFGDLKMEVDRASKNEVRQERLDKLGAMRHPYRI